MDDLRWILLLVGAVVLVAIYFSGRFESEDWARERKQSRTGLSDKTSKKADGGENSASQSVAVARSTVKKEPTMGIPEPVVEKPERHESNDMSLVDVPEANSIVEPSINIDDNEAINAKRSGVIEDEITEVEIPANLAIAEAEIHIADIVLDEELEQASIPSGIEPLVLSVSVFADEGENFNGSEIKEALEAEGLLYGTMRIFHFYDPDKKDIVKNDDAVFSVAAVLEPGFFDLEKLDEMKTPGLMLFCQLPGPLPGQKALEVMLDKGRGLAVRLHGHLCDDRRNPFTIQAKNHYLDRITAFDRKLVLARKKYPQAYTRGD